MKIIYIDELYHYGVKGMRWGVRKKYETKGGSYTRAGLKRYDDSYDAYHHVKNARKELKKSGSTTLKTSKGDLKITPANKREKKQIDEALKTTQIQYKNQMKKDKRHLKDDYLGDKGKVRYARGERIRGNNAVSSALRKAGGLSISAAATGHQMHIGSTKAHIALAAVGGTLIAASYVSEAAYYGPNKELRAYYGHTSNY